jgi:flagellar basal body-associated protein FliL
MGEVLAVGGSLVVGGLMIWLIIEFLWLIAVIVGLALLVSGALLWWMFRHGSDVATASRAALPPPSATPLPPRSTEALPASQQLHIHLHGMTPDEAAERLTAIREAGYRAWPERGGR